MHDYSGTLALVAAATAALVFGGADGAQPATHLAEAPSSSVPSTTSAPPVTVTFSGHAKQDMDYYVVVSRDGDPYPVTLAMVDDSGNWTTADAGDFSAAFTFATLRNPDPSGWDVFDTTGTYTATLVLTETSQTSEFSEVTSMAHVSGGTTTYGGTSVSWTVG